ncbi:MAG: methionine--tRNA ligase [Olsenella profusa]
MPTTDKPSFFITTPIYYVNAKPHLGTAYSTILCDVQARYRRARGFDVKFLTGMDEHGEKVEEAAREHGMTPQEWCDNQVPFFEELWRTLEISNDDFIRTTEPRQVRAVQYLWERMRESGYLYKGSYDGWYCVPEETYFTESQVCKSDEENHTEGRHLCPDCGRPLERVQEESWFFRLSAFQDRLLALYDEHPDFVMPDFRMREVRSFVEGGLTDLSVSRTSFDWGIKLPFDERHVTYVWFDALLNYMTAVGYGQGGDEAAAELAFRWPAQYHVVGKDIIRFHCVIWPAMLMAVGEALPGHVFAHGFLMVKNEETGQGEKMSKSRGNAIAPQDVIDLLGVEGYRYYFMTDVVPGEDGAISFSRMEQVYNADLANSWGNLVSRALNMSAKYFGGRTPAFDGGWAVRENPLRAIAEGIAGRYAAHMDKMEYVGARDVVMELVHAANHYVEDSTPWAVAKDPTRVGELSDIICNLLEAIRVSAHLLAPFMPETSAEVLRRMDLAAEVDSDDLAAACAWGQIKGGVEVTKGAALFPRLGGKR